MACTPFVVTSGLFINNDSTSWLGAPTTSVGGKTVKLTTTGFAGISVTGPTGTMPFHVTLPGYASKYQFFGSNNNLLLLDADTSTPSTRRVSLVDFTTTPPTERLLFTVLATGTNVPLPSVQYSQGTGTAVLVFGPDGVNIQGLAIYRSDNGALLCSGPPPFIATGQTEGEATATALEIHYSSGGTNQLVTCLLPTSKITATPNPLAFGPVKVGAPKPLILTLSNTGNNCLIISSISSSDAHFTVSSGGPLSVGPGSNITVTVTFTPSSAAAFAGTLTLTTNDPSHPTLMLPLSGTGAFPHISVSPMAANFGNVATCLSGTSPIMISNTGSVPLTVSSITASGPPFTVSPAMTTVGPGGMSPVAAHFTPSALGIANGTLVITSDDPSNPTIHVNLIGNGIPTPPPKISVSPANLDFGATPLQYFIGLRVTVTNAGPCQSLNVTLMTSGAPFFVTAVDPPTVPPGNITLGDTVDGTLSKRFVVVFAPTTLGVANGTLTISSNDPTNPTVTIPLTGNGVTLNPTALELVLDRSGSMAAPASGGSKMDALKAAVHLFADLVIPGQGDEMGTVEFDDAFGVLTPLGSFDAALRTMIESNVDTLTPRHNTSIGGGLQLGESQLAPSALGRKVILVFTDGLENTPPMVATVEPGILATGTEVYAIGLGQPQNISTAILSELAASSKGRFFLTDDPLILRKNFVQVLADAFRHNMVADPILTLHPGEELNIPVSITECESRITFVLMWDDPTSVLEMEIEAPDGTLFTPASPSSNQLVRYGQYPSYRYYQIAFPPLDPGSGLSIGPNELGTWVMHLRAISLNSGSQRCVTNVLVESELELQAIVHAIDPASPIQVQVTILHQGSPVDGAQVILTLTAPQKSLAAISTPPVVLQALQADIHPIPTGQKPLIPTKISEYRMVGSEQGQYVIELPPPQLDGVYDFAIKATGEACGGTFERFTGFSLYIGSNQLPTRSSRVRNNQRSPVLKKPT